MKKLTLIAALAIATPGIVQAETYVELRGGGTWLDDTDAFDPGTLGTAISNAEVSLDTGWVGALAVGYDPTGPFRFEVEYSHRENDIDIVTGVAANPTPPPSSILFSASVPGRIATDALLILGYADIPLVSVPKLTPYIGVGAGVAFTDIEINGVSDSETMVALQLSAGAAVEITSSLDLTATASLFFADQDLPAGGDIDQIGRTLTAGLRYSF